MNQFDLTGQHISTIYPRIIQTVNSRYYDGIGNTVSIGPGLIGPQGPQGPQDIGAAFYLQGTTTYAYDTTSDIYRSGSLSIGTGTASDSRFIVSSLTGSASLVADNFGYVYNKSRGSTNTLFGYGAGPSTIGTHNTGIGYVSLFNNGTGVATLQLENPGLGYTASSTYPNVQLSYISGSTASTYPIVTVVVGAGGTVSTIKLVNTGTGFTDTSTVMGSNLGSGATFSVNVLTIVSGNNNTALGSFSLNKNVTGVANVGIGYASAYSNISGLGNVGLGFRTLYLNSIGSFNTALGYRALYSTNADKNTALGAETMFSNLTGTFNTALGQESLRGNTAGSFNTAVGMFALLNSESNYTTALGRDAGRFSSVGNLTSSTESLFLGYNSKSLGATSVNEIVIGASAAGNGSNTVTLGNDNISKTILKGNIGIGTTAPANLLDVVKNQAGSTRINIENTDASGISTLRFTKSGGAAAALYENVSNQFTFQNATNGGTLRLQTTTSGGTTNTALTIDANQNIGIGTITPNASTILDLTSTSKGFLPPRMTTDQKNTIATPVQGLIVYDTDLISLFQYNGTAWVAIGTSGTGGNQGPQGFQGPIGSTGTSYLAPVLLDTYLGTRLTPTDTSYNGFSLSKSINGQIGLYVKNTDNTGNAALSTISAMGSSAGLYDKGMSMNFANNGYFISALQNSGFVYSDSPLNIIGQTLDFRFGPLTASTSVLKINSSGKINIGVKPDTDNAVVEILGRKSDGSLILIDDISQITITTSVSITTDTLASNGLSQKGRNVIIDNGANVINVTVNGGTDFCSSYVKHGTGAITFVQGSSRTMIRVDSTAVLNGIAGSTAVISSIGTTDYLRISNA